MPPNGASGMQLTPPLFQIAAVLVLHKANTEVLPRGHGSAVDHDEGAPRAHLR